MADLDKVLTGVGSIASPVATIGSSVLNGIFQSRENRRNREWTEQQNDLAWQRQNQLIKEQRSYDTPKAQMQRLMEAGLNPNLIYGDLGGNMQAQSAPNAAGSYQGFAPQLDPLSLSQSLLNMANARKADKDSQLSEAEAKRVYKLSDAEYGKLVADSDFIRQKINLSSFQEKVELFRRDLFDDIGYAEGSTDEYGNMVMRSFSNELRALIANNTVDKLKADSSDYNKAIELFFTDIGYAKAKKENLDLQNQDLAEFVKVCARIYESQASQADYMKSVSELNQEFYGKIGASNDVIKLVFSFLQLIVGGISNFTPRKSVSTHNFNYNSNKYD